MSAALAGPSAAFVDFEAALGQLNADDDPRSGPWAWLEAAYADPEGYEAALFAHAARALGVGSERGVAYDFFADLCGRRIDPRAVAIRARRGGTAGLEAVGYRELEARSRVLGGALRRAGVQPGDAVALCHRDFIDDAVARLAVLRCGAVLCPIAPRGRSQVRHELEVLAPPYLICCDISALWLEGLAVVRVRAEASDDAALPAGASTAYGAGAAVLRMVSRYDGSQRQVVEVTAHRLFVGLLSTALLLLDTPRCRSVAFPGAEGDTELLVSAATWLGGGDVRARIAGGAG
jgi:non-ribosomal peptide synthetase component F